mmetsp:Transcript_12662/g.32391  ORF Transcript_12662/g.32391 Transcript_12662/m.32391 type:complete len:205 (+) Transcript_12662:3600-4214(+)
MAAYLGSGDSLSTGLAPVWRHCRSALDPRHLALASLVWGDPILVDPCAGPLVSCCRPKQVELHLSMQQPADDNSALPFPRPSTSSLGSDCCSQRQSSSVEPSTSLECDGPSLETRPDSSIAIESDRLCGATMHLQRVPRLPVVRQLPQVLKTTFATRPNAVRLGLTGRWCEASAHRLGRLWRLVQRVNLLKVVAVLTCSTQFCW